MPRQISLSVKRQLHHSRIHKQTRRNPQQSITCRSRTKSNLGGTRLHETIRHTHPRSVEHTSELSQPKPAGSRRMGTASRSVLLPQINLMASKTNHKVPNFFACYRDPTAMGVDAMTQDWRFNFEPLGGHPERLLTWKVAFLVTISSTRRVSELGALSRDPY